MLALKASRENTSLIYNIIYSFTDIVHIVSVVVVVVVGEYGAGEVESMEQIHSVDRSKQSHAAACSV